MDIFLLVWIFHTDIRGLIINSIFRMEKTAMKDKVEHVRESNEYKKKSYVQIDKYFRIKNGPIKFSKIFLLIFKKFKIIFKIKIIKKFNKTIKNLEISMQADIKLHFRSIFTFRRKKWNKIKKNSSRYIYIYFLIYDQRYRYRLKIIKILKARRSFEKKKK